MLRPSPLIALLLLGAAGCTSQPTLGRVEARLVPVPSRVAFGDVGVGHTEVRVVELDLVRGDEVEISALEVVQDLESDFFEVRTQAPLSLTRGGTARIEVAYAPRAAGEHGAGLLVHSDAEEPVIEIDLVGIGWDADVAVYPTAMEFGPIDPGEVSVRTFTVRNDAGMALGITSADATHAGFSLAEALPITVRPGDEQVLTVIFEPYAFGPVGGTLVVHTDLGDLPPITVTGNDCLLGDPDAFDRDDDGVTECGGDCDDRRADVVPGNPEWVDGVDQDCDGLADQGTSAFDDDGDGWCEVDCTDGSRPGDCHDGLADVHPSADEAPFDGRDDDCDGIVDHGAPDGDGDGFSLEGGDCDPDDSTVFPAAPERVDGRDNSCDGVADEGTEVFDDDGDGWCEHPTVCGDGSVAGDCDDTAFGVHPHGLELPNGRDDDCDGDLDEGTENVDDDADGFSEVQGDCDDQDASRSPRLGNC